jgi:hypothetical protein
MADSPRVPGEARIASSDRIGATAPRDLQKPKVDKPARRAAGGNGHPRVRPGSNRSRTTVGSGAANFRCRDTVQAAMPTDKVALAKLRWANARRAADNRRRIADIERRKALEDREEAKRAARFASRPISLRVGSCWRSSFGTAFTWPPHSICAVDRLANVRASVVAG